MPTDFLHGIETIEVNDGARPIQTVKSSVIAIIGSAAQGPVNQPVLILGQPRKAAEIFGPADGMGTIPDALDAIFDQAGAWVVVINVCDPATHNTAVAEASYTLNALGQIQLPKRNVSAVVVKNQAATTTYVAGTDYEVDTTSGIVSRKTTGAITALQQLKISFTYVDPTKVTAANIVGAAGSPNTGVHVLRDVKSVTNVTPRLLAAPGFTGTRPSGAANPVVAELLAYATKFRAIILADGPNSDANAAVTYRGDWGSDRIFICEVFSQIFDVKTNQNIIAPSSARVAGLIARVDGEIGFWASPSNHVINGIVGTARAVDFALSDPNCEANFLNANSVGTIIRNDGFRLWGNRTTATDPLWTFLSVRRTADMVYESIENAMLWAMDKPFSQQLIQDILESVNAYLRGLKARGAIINGRAWLDPEMNQSIDLQAGKLTVDFDLEPPAPLERLTFRAHRNGEYYEELVNQVIEAAA